MAAMEQETTAPGEGRLQEKGSIPFFPLRENINPNLYLTVQLQRPVKNHTTAKPNKLAVKRIHFDELYASMVSDRSTDQ